MIQTVHGVCLFVCPECTQVCLTSVSPSKTIRKTSSFLEDVYLPYSAQLKKAAQKLDCWLNDFKVWSPLLESSSNQRRHG